MCGICGSVSLSGAEVDPAPVRAMLERMVHRGPDSDGLLQGRGVVAGIRRLAVIDVSGGGQPIDSEDGNVTVVFNGEIYNFRELRRELESQGHRFRSASDTEVLVHLWEDHGPDLVHLLDGMFAFCIHDRSRGETFLARDRMGIKPLYYHRAGDRLVFASELAVLLRHGDVPAEVDPIALMERFSLQFVPGERTIYREIRELLPGHTMLVRRGEAIVSRYWEIPRGGEGSERDEETAAAELLDLLADSVRARRVSDVPLGVFLSGGIDSSAIAWLLSRIADHPVRTFSVGFDEPEFDERESARAVARHCGADHRELVLSPVAMAEHLPRLIRHLDEPVTDPAMIPTYLLAEFARQEVTVVLAGEGADELFGGYRRYLYQERLGWLSGVPGLDVARRAARGVLPRRIDQALEALGGSDAAAAHVSWSATMGRQGTSALFDETSTIALGERLASAFAGYFPATDAKLHHRLRADQSEWLPHNLLAKVDRATMAFSLEARVPFLDHRIVEWAAALPDSHKIRGTTTKAVLRQAFRDALPTAILERPKRGFDLPLAEWIRGPLRETSLDLLTEENLRRWEGLDVTAARSLLEEHLAGRDDHGLPLFNLLSTMLFLEGRRA